MRKLAIILMFLCVMPLTAEIEWVIIKWTPGLCLTNCTQILGPRLRQIPGVSEVSIDQPQAQAQLRWLPGFTFSYTPIEAALAWVGLSINPTGLRVKVRGQIMHDRVNIGLVSIGDGTAFILLSPVAPRLSGYTEEFNVASYVLTPQTRDQLLQAEATGQIVTIQGPIFSPWRSPPDPLMLIIEQITFSPPPAPPPELPRFQLPPQPQIQQPPGGLIRPVP